MMSIAEKILFIKPFEIDSSNNSLKRVWKSLEKILIKADGVFESGLFCSLYNISKYGYISYSVWDSKLSFIKASKDNIVWKYHVSKNGENNNAYRNYLYRVIEHQKMKTKLKGTELFLVDFIDADKINQSVVKDYLNIIKNNLINQNLLQEIYLAKSISKSAKYNYIIMSKLKIDNRKTIETNSFLVGDNSRTLPLKNNKISIYYKSNLKSPLIKNIIIK